MAKVINWEDFVKGEVYDFMRKFDLQKITVDNGSKNGSISISSKSEVNVKITSNETI